MAASPFCQVRPLTSVQQVTTGEKRKRDGGLQGCGFHAGEGLETLEQPNISLADQNRRFLGIDRHEHKAGEVQRVETQRDLLEGAKSAGKEASCGQKNTAKRDLQHDKNAGDAHPSSCEWGSG